MNARRKERIEHRFRSFLMHRGQVDPNIRPRIQKVLADQGLFDQTFNFALERARGDSNLAEAFEGDGDDIPHPILNKLVDFFIANWKEILAFIMSLFMNPAGNGLELASEAEEINQVNSRQLEGTPPRLREPEEDR